MGRRTLPPRRRVPFRRAGGWARRVLARVLAGAGRKLGPRVARVRRVRLCWELFQCGRLQVGGRGEGEGPWSAARVIIWPQPDPPQPPPGLWLRAESGVSLWVLSWGPPGRGCLQVGPGPAGRPGVGGGRAGPGARGRGSLCGTGTGSEGRRWDGARRRRGGQDCAGLGAWCRLGFALGPGHGRGAVWDGGQQQWPSLGASAAGACGRCGGQKARHKRRAKKQKDIFRISLGTELQSPASSELDETEETLAQMDKLRHGAPSSRTGPLRATHSQAATKRACSRLSLMSLFYL